MNKDGQNLTTAFIDTSNQTIKLLDDTEKTLAALKGLEFPKALADLKIEVPSVFRLPKGGFHATSFSSCCPLSQAARNCVGDL